MPYDPNRYGDWLKSRGSNYSQPTIRHEVPRESPSVWGDVAMAPLRGIEGAFQDAWGLLDTVAFDALPDWNERVLGESKTWQGGIVEGFANFLAGFLPVAGVMTKMGRVAKLAKAAKLVKTGARGANELTFLGDLAAGAIADVAVFSKQDENLSTLIESMPALRNPVTEFLAIDENDTEVAARIKNVMEGAGLGMLMAPFLAGLRSMRKRNAGLRDGKTVDEIAAELADETDFGAIEGGLAYRRLDEQPGDEYWFHDPSKTDPEKITKGGTIVGSPGLTPDTLLPLRKLTAEAAKKGEVARYWYEESGKAIREIVGGNLEDADKLAKALAVTSPGTNVKDNAQAGLQAFHAWKRGVPLDEFLTNPEYRVGMQEMQEKLGRALYGMEDGKNWYGRKTFNFYTNLMREIDPQRTQGSTIDMWMARLYGLPTDSVDGRAYDFMQREVKAVADRMGWEPHQVQASMWTYSKALWESLEPQWRAEAESLGMTLTVDKGSKTVPSPEYAAFQRQKFQEAAAADLGTSGGITVDDSYSFLEALHEKPIVFAHEVLPADFPFEAVSPQERLAFTTARQRAFIDPDTGIDEVSKELGWGPRGYEGAGASVALPSTTPKGGEVKLSIEENTRRLATEWAYIHAAISGQSEVFMVRTWDKPTGRGANALKIPLGRPVTTDDTLEVLHLMEVLGLEGEGYQAFARGDSVYIARVDGKEMGLGAGKAKRLKAQFDQTPVNEDLWNTRPAQQFTSAATDVNQATGKVPALFGKVEFEPNSVNLDIGGGKGSMTTDALAGRSVKNLVFDPFNRTQTHNKKVAKLAAGGRVDTVTAANVLNVIKEPANREAVIRQAADALKPEGKAYFQVYGGSGDGVPGPTTKGWQNNRTAETYLDEIGQYFETVTRKGDVIEASGPKLSANPQRLAHKLRQTLSQDLLKGPYKAAAKAKVGTARRVAGHSYTASEAAWHALGGPESGWKPMQVRHEGVSHWFLRKENTGEILDITAAQFDSPVPYSQAKGKGFLTKAPSSRAKTVLSRMDAVEAREFSPTTAYVDVIHDRAKTPAELRQRAYDLGYGERLERVESRVKPRLDAADSEYGPKGWRRGPNGDVPEPPEVRFLRDPDGEGAQSVDDIRGELDGLARSVSNGTEGTGRGSFFVSHGSGAEFTRWKKSARKGFGGDAYGAGAYGATDPAVSQSYQRGTGEETLWLGGEDFTPNSLEPDELRLYNAIIGTGVDDAGEPDWGAVADFIEQKYDGDAREALEKLATEWSEKGVNLQLPGYNYTFEVFGDTSKEFLNWDAPLHEQPPAAIRGIVGEADWAEIGPYLEKKRSGTLDLKRDRLSKQASTRLTALGDSGGDLYKAYVRAHGTKKRASAMLREAGIKGNVAPGGNVVVFSPKDFKIKKRVSSVSGPGGEVLTFYADFDTLTKQLEHDVEIGAYNHPQDIEAVKEFVRRVGGNFFDGVGLRTAMGESASSYEFISKTVTLGGRAIRSGEIKRDLLHEFWHHLSRYVEPRYKTAVEEAYKKDLAQALAKDPSLEARIRDKRARLGTDTGAPPGRGLGEADYRYLSPDEWWAEVMTERSLAKLDLFAAADQPGIKGLIAHARLWWTETVNAISARFGGDRTQKMLDDFLRGRASTKMRDYYGIGIEQSKMWKDPDLAPKPAAVLRHLGIDDNKVDDIVARIQDRLDKQLDPKVNPRNLTGEELIAEELSRGDLNLVHWAGREDGMTLIRVMEDLYGSFMESDVASLNRPQSFDQQTARALRERAAILGEEPETAASRWRASMRQDQANLRQAVGRIHAHKTLLMGMGDELAQMASKIREGASKQDTAAFAQATQFYAEMLAGVKGLNAEVGRGLGFMRRNVIPFDKIKIDVSDLDAYLSGHGGRGKVEKLAEQIATAATGGGIEGTAAAARVVQATWRRQAVSVFNEYWINALLSGPRTLTVNFMSGVLMSIYRPMELMLGSGIQAMTRRGGGQEFATGAEELMRLSAIFGENSKASFKMAGKAIDDDVGPVLTGRAMFDDRPKAQMHAIRSDSDTLWGSAINFLGRTVRIPTRLMAGGDEFIKQMNYRTVGQTHFHREGVNMGLTGEALAKHIQDRMDKLIYEGQAYSQETLYRRGLDEAKASGIVEEAEAREFAAKYVDENWDDDLGALGKMAREAAEEVTFTTPLTQGSASHWLQQMVNAHPQFRIVLPFIRTPVNIAGFAYQRLNPLYLGQALMGTMFPKTATALEGSRSKIVQGLLSSDPRTQARAMGAMGAGIGFWTIGTALAMNGVITGRGPGDPEQRRILEAEGWLPYSIKTKDGYVQYSRLDPFSTLLGVFADTADYMRFAPPTNDAPLVYGIATALANNFTNKTYLTGIRNMVEALTDPDRKAEKWIKRQMGSMVPNVLGQGVSVTDPDMREVRTMLDAMMSKVPGLSDNLAPQRNVLGERVGRIQSIDYDTLKSAGVPEGIASFTNWYQPVMYRSTKDDLVTREMASLGHGWTPPKTTKNGINLVDFRNSRGQDAYDRWGELQGNIQIGGSTLRESLRKLITSKGYQNMSSESTLYGDSPRVQAISNVISRYRRRAYSKLKEEFPDLSRAERDIFDQRRRAKYGSKARRILEN